MSDDTHPNVTGGGAEAEWPRAAGGGDEPASKGEEPTPGGPAGADDSDSRSMASSVTRHAPFSGVGEWKFLACNPDTLDLGLYVHWGDGWDDLRESLERGKAQAVGTGGIPWEDGSCLILAGGKPPNYRWQLQWPGFQLYIGRSDSPQGSTPNVYASINSKSLWELWVTGAVELVRQAVEALGGRVERIKPSRCDLAADYLIPGGLTLDFLRSHRVPRHVDNSQRMSGDTLQTFYVGAERSPIRLRIYDKAAEVLQGGTKLWFLAIWDVQECRDVWRVEFQLRRPVLKQVQVSSVEDLIGHLGGLWGYLTGHWFSLRLPDNSNATRRTVHPFWQDVQGRAQTFGELAAVARVRSLSSVASVERAVACMSGYLVGYASRLGIPDLKAALEHAAEAMQRRLRSDFHERYRVRSIKLGRDPDVVEGGQSDAA